MYGICQAPKQTFRYLSGLDRHHFDPDTASRFDADPYPESTKSLTNIGKSEHFLKLSFTAVPVCIVLYFSSAS